MRIRAQVTDVTVSGPNFKGTRISTGRKYRFASVAFMSVFLVMLDSSYLCTGISTIYWNPNIFYGHFLVEPYGMME